MICETISIQSPNIPENTTAILTTYVQDNFAEIDITRKRPAIVICPGGGYSMVSEREGEPIAIKMMSFGFQAFVLKYSVAPNHFPTALLQLAEAVKLVREKSDIWHIDTEKIIVAGFSAGGHLAASLGVMWNSSFLKSLMDDSPQNWRPNGLMLGYPVISSGKIGHQDSFKNLLGPDFSEKAAQLSLENLVTEETPPTFIWHTAEDDLVLMENSLAFVTALRRYRIPLELHIFSKGGHGLSLGTQETQIQNGYGLEPTIQRWPQLFADWLNTIL